MLRDIECPACDTKFEAKEWDAGECLKCKNKYGWDKMVAYDGSDCWTLVTWESYEKIAGEVMVDKTDDKMVHALAEGARERLRKAIAISEESRKVRFQRMVDVEAICLAGDRKPPKRLFLFARRCPRCGGKLDKDKLRELQGIEWIVHKLYSCVDCNYEWAKGDKVEGAAQRDHVKEIIPPPKDTKAVKAFLPRGH